MLTSLLVAAPLGVIRMGNCQHETRLLWTMVAKDLNIHKATTIMQPLENSLERGEPILRRHLPRTTNHKDDIP